MGGFLYTGGQLMKSALKAVIPDSTRQRLRAWQHRQQDRRTFRRHLRPTDVFLVGHPKSGNTMLAYMLAMVLRQKFHPKQPTLANIGEFIPAFHARDSDIRKYDAHPDPRIFRNEGPVYPELYPKTIYILRDPRAALVSYYHHCVHDDPDHPWSLDSYLDEILTYGCIRKAEPHLIRWDKQVLAWFDRARRQPVLIVRYEEMVRDRRSTLEQVIRFAGIACSEEDVALAVENSSFEKMRENELRYGAEPYSGTRGERGFFVRKGKTNGWKEELSPDQVRRIESTLAEAMKLTGYLPQ